MLLQRFRLAGRPLQRAAAAVGRCRSLFIQTEGTPNPDSLKFLPGKPLLDHGTRDFRSEDEATASPLARRIFGLNGVSGVFFTPDYLTVSKVRTRRQRHAHASTTSPLSGRTCARVAG